MSEQDIRVLLIDDDEDYFVIVRDLLAEVNGFRVELTWLDTYEKGLAALSQNHTDVGIVDYRLGVHSGLELLAEASARKVNVPFILLTGQGDQETAVAAMKAGAVDYLVKGQVDPALLERSIRHALETSHNRRLVRRMVEILETTHDLVGSCDSKGLVTYLNAAGRRMLGTGQEEDLSGSSITQFHPPSIADLLTNVGLPAADTEGSWSGETVLLSRTGQKIPVLQAIIAHKAADGRTEFYSTTARDISDRKRSEDILRASEERYRGLFETMREGFALCKIICDDDGKPIDFHYLEVNSSFEKIIGVKRSEALNKSARELFPTIEQYWIDNYGTVALSGVSTHFENYFGTVGKHFEVTAFSPKRGQFAVVFTDITDRKHKEEQLRLQSTALESAANSIVITDSEGAIRWVNPAFLKLTGYTVEEVLGQNPRILKSGKQLPEFYAEMWRVIRSGSVWRGEMVNRRKDGSLYNEEMVVTPVHDSEGHATHYIAIKQDITERKKAEELLQQTNKRLVDALQDLKAAQAQIIQQERLRAVGTMASGIAHDFNNALAAILGFSELLIHRPENLDDREKTLSFLKTMNTTAKDAGDVVNRLREFYRHRDDKKVLKPVKLNEIVRESVSVTQPRWVNEAQAKGIAIEMRTQLEDVPVIPGDESELREALANLIFNAADAMPHGGTITLRTFKENQEVVLEVSDTGTGMTEEVRQHCLEPFFSTKGQHGTGLGLSTVYGAVRRHDGKIDIRTQLGKGTTFQIRLPLRSAGIVEEDTKTEKVAPQVRQLQVLVVDDEVVVRQIIAEYIKADGHLVEVASNGTEGLDKFGKKHFDLVVLDRAMPGMSGDQLASQIKSANPNIPIIMLTGFGTMMMAADEKPAGVDLLMGKPVTMDGLRGAFAKAIAGMAPADSPEHATVS